MMDATIIRIERERNTPNGNPVWRVFTDLGVYLTAPDYQVGSLISDEWAGRDVDMVLDGKGQITHLTHMRRA